MKIALALIVKGTPEEAKFLAKCLANVSPYVDGIFVTSTHKRGEEPSNDISKISSQYGAKISYFEWCNDFAAARNFNFKQVTTDYDYILWCDADDTFNHLYRLRNILEVNPNVDALAFWYWYAFNEQKNPVVIHKKTQVIKNDGCVEWTGKLHEDFKENRSLNVQFVEGIQRVHNSNDDRARANHIRNVEISKEEAKQNPDDPRVYFNLGNSYFGANKFKEAKKEYEKFLKTSGSDDEKFVIHQRLSSVDKVLGNKDEAIAHLQIAIGMYPDYPDGYNSLGALYFDLGMYDAAERYYLIGLVTKPKYHRMIVYNPRDYDYNPMMALAKVYFQKSRPDMALPLLKGCLKIYPNDLKNKSLVEEMEKETVRLKNVLDVIERIKTYGNDKVKILTEINMLPNDLQSHPGICQIRNAYFVKETSTGKDIAYYCGQTAHEWNPEMMKTQGIGGSEEAVINLAKEWTKIGYNVTVFNSCGPEVMVCDGVTYKPFWHYNAKDKYDITIAWRHPRIADYDLNTTKLFVDLHDVIPAGEFTEKRLSKIDKIFVKTNAHRVLFPKVPDEKISIIPNGQDPELFKQDIKKDPFLLVNTSSPDRSMDVLPKLFKMIKKEVPQARLKWAYGWEIWDNAFRNDKDKMAWKENIIKEMEQAGIENCGRLSQKDAAKLYLEGSILAYPSEFYEIDCISVKKAQAAGCVPFTTDFAAFKESNEWGSKSHSNKTIDDWSKPYQFHFGIEDEDLQKIWVDSVITYLKDPYNKNTIESMKSWAEKFNWDKIAKIWIQNV